MIFILPIAKIFDKIYAYNLVCRLEVAFPCLFCQKLRENRMFLRFFSQKLIFAYSLCIFSIIMFKILRSRLHYDVIVSNMQTDGIWYQWKKKKKETHSYTALRPHNKRA